MYSQWDIVLRNERLKSAPVVIPRRSNDLSDTKMFNSRDVTMRQRKALALDKRAN